MISHFRLLCFLVGATVAMATNTYNVGRGIADCTGAVAEGTLYGYADPLQDARGLHLRQFSRAFIVEDRQTSKRIVLVVPEIPMVSQHVHRLVLERLAEIYGDLYTAENVMISPTHTHAGAGGFHTYWMYMAPTRGLVNETVNSYVNGMVKSIERAHNDLQPGKIFVGSDVLLGASVNRSPYSYEHNPEEERARYEHDVDKEMTVVKFVSEAGEELGMVNFFAIHPVSMRKSNHLISSDNKGVASLLFEAYKNPGSLPGKGKFVAAFTQLSMADVSPNILGAFCDVTMEPCDYVTSMCPENPKDPRLCNAYSPKMEEFADTILTGEKQFNKAKEIYDGDLEELTGPVNSVFQFKTIAKMPLEVNGEQVETCLPAMGYSFGAGITDGPGIPPFKNAETESSLIVDTITKRILGIPQSRSQKRCQSPKPLLINTGEAPWPQNGSWPWQPTILPFQMLQIGNLVVSGVPAEVTTMAGRRIGEAVKEVATSNGMEDGLRSLVVSMANSYASYVTTFEEYQIQRYESASTPYGPHTLSAYIDIFRKMTPSLIKGESLTSDISPPDLSAYPRQGIPDIRIDNLPGNQNYGDITLDAFPAYRPGSTVIVRFVSGNPRNDLRIEGTYLEVQQLQDDESWVTIATDASIETRFYWLSDCHDNLELLRCSSSQYSEARMEWAIPVNQADGAYRLVHYGAAMTQSGSVTNYTGVSRVFDVVNV